MTTCEILSLSLEVAYIISIHTPLSLGTSIHTVTWNKLPARCAAICTLSQKEKTVLVNI